MTVKAAALGAGGAEGAAVDRAVGCARVGVGDAVGEGDRVAVGKLAALELAPIGVHPLVDVGHELVEMGAPPPLDPARRVEQIHQHGLAAADLAVEIEAADEGRPLALARPEQPAQRRRLAGDAVGDEALLQAGEGLHHAGLGAVTLDLAGGAGLAAPQIGVHERVALVKFGQDSEDGMRKPITLINPQIISAGSDEKGFDGCLSIPGVVTWDTLRPSPLIFSALDERGETFQMEVSGIDARVVHHEIDHLDGILFLDRVKDFNKVYRSVETEEGEKLISLASLKAKIEKEIFKTTPIEKVLGRS